MGVSEMPGKGGISRGRGDAELTWGDEAQGRTDQFEAKALPDARTLDPDSTGIVDVAATAPTVEPTAQAAGATDVQASAGKSAWKRRLAPHHREAVQEFFGKDGKER